MLLLLFETKEGRYALPTNIIVEVVPMVKLKKIPKVPPYVLGMLNYRGTALPVIDLCALLEGEESLCEKLLSTRIIIINYTFKKKPKQMLGLLAEHVTETIKVKHDNHQTSGVLLDDDISSAISGREKDEMIQWFDLKRMVPERTIKDLYQE